MTHVSGFKTITITIYDSFRGVIGLNAQVHTTIIVGTWRFSLGLKLQWFKSKSSRKSVSNLYI